MLGHVGNEGSGCQAGQRAWELKTLASNQAFVLNTDADGSAWLIIGTDSGFEGRSQLYYTNLKAEFTPR